jgi:hypothetical protein
MEESMIHMDHELSNARMQVAERDEEIDRMRFELQLSLKNESDTMGSVSLQLSATKDETRQLRSANDSLRNYVEELEATVNEQQSSLLDLRHYVSELEIMAGVAPRVWASTRTNQQQSAKSGTSSPRSSFNDDKALHPPNQTRGASFTDAVDVISDIEVEISETIPEKRGLHKGEYKDGPSTPRSHKGKLLAKEAALAALERVDSVRPISNRGDGSFGFQLLSPTTDKSTTGKSPASVEKWAYTREEISNSGGSSGKSLLPPPPPDSLTRSPGSPPKKPSIANKPSRNALQPITASKWSSRDTAPVSPRSESKYSGSPRQVHEDKKASRNYGMNGGNASDRRQDYREVVSRDDSDTDDGVGEKTRREGEVRHKEHSSRARVASPKRHFKQPKSAPTLRA